MAPGDYSTSTEEHQETRGPEAHLDYRNAVRQSALGILDHSYIIGCLGQVNIKQHQPILKGLQCEAAKDEPDAERAEASLWKIVSIVFDVRIDRCSNACDDACYQAHANRK